MRVRPLLCLLGHLLCLMGQLLQMLMLLVVVLYVLIHVWRLLLWSQETKAGWRWSLLLGFG